MTARSDLPTIYVIAGPNGAGKSTFAKEFIPQVADPPEFLNADFIAAGLAPLRPDLQRIRAGRILLERMRELAAARADFGIETTLSGRSCLRLFSEFRRDGYRLICFFLWRPIAEFAVARVANRVAQGGHDVPEQDIRRRYTAGLRNFFVDYRDICDAWWLHDASHCPPRLIAKGSDVKIEVEDASRYGRIRRYVGGEGA